MDAWASWVDTTQPSLLVAAAAIAFNPVFWNIAARTEHSTRWLTRIAGGSPYRGCYALGITIFALGLLRDWLFSLALADQPRWHMLDTLEYKAAAAVLYAVGGTMVLSSMWALGFTGTYLGDYFGILMQAKVEGFPFNVMRDPMYDGASMVFLATALWHASPAGLLLTAEAYVAYRIALLFEAPFTDRIYAQAAAQRAAKHE